MPRIGIEAKFSLPGVSALSLLGHDLTVPGVRSADNEPVLHPLAYYTLNYIPEVK